MFIASYLNCTKKCRLIESISYSFLLLNVCPNSKGIILSGRHYIWNFSFFIKLDILFLNFIITQNLNFYYSNAMNHSTKINFEHLLDIFTQICERATLFLFYYLQFIFNTEHAKICLNLVALIIIRHPQKLAKSGKFFNRACFLWKWTQMKNCFLSILK